MKKNLIKSSYRRKFKFIFVVNFDFSDFLLSEHISEENIKMAVVERNFSIEQISSPMHSTLTLTLSGCELEILTYFKLQKF